MNPITFSTLACPNWQIKKVIAKATEYGYDGIEWRGTEGHVQPDMSAASKVLLRRTCSDAGLLSLAVTAYTSFVSNVVDEQRANVVLLQQYADLAAELGAKYVRTFLGELPRGAHLDSSLYEKISVCLKIASEYANSIGVKIAVEPHDDFVHSRDVVPLFEPARSHRALRVIWDIGNAYSVGESPAEGFELLKGHLAYVQVKDGIRRGPDWRLCQLGESHVPLIQAFELLLADDYQGAFSVEWEYAWHPELDAPEIALPAALKMVRALLASSQPEST